METSRESERQAWWPLDTMACSLDASASSSCSLFGRDPQLFYFGHAATGIGASGFGADEIHNHELELIVDPKYMESLVSEASTAATGLPAVQDAMAVRRELDELLQNLWDSDEKGLSSYGALKESGNSFQHDHHFDTGTTSPTVPTCPERTLSPPPQEEPPSSSSSHGRGDSRASDTTVAQRETVGANRSSKRSAPEGAEKESTKGDASCKRNRTSSSAIGAGSPVLRPFAVVKPSGADGEVTLADINEWMLRPPARPVRHPVGEFACAPRVSGRTVAGFTRLRTAGRGTVTVVKDQRLNQGHKRATV